MSETGTNFSDICTACGLCCDGTLFGHALLEPDELEASTASGLTLEDFAGKPGFAQPCLQLCGTSCGIYLDRPKVCRDYRCTMLKRVADGEVAATDATRHIAEVRGAVANLQSELLPGETVRESKDRLQKALESPGEAEASPKFKLMLGVVELLLDKHFRRASQRVFSSMTS